MKCDRCGLQSDVQQAFSREKRFFGRPKYFCPDCTVKRYTVLFLTEVVLLSAGGLLLSALNAFSGIATFYTDILLGLLYLGPLILIHELAHAAVARLVGLRVFGIVLGIGKPVWSGKFLGMDWTVNALPLGGITLAGAPPSPGIRAKLFLVYLAGPASHIVLAAASFLLMQMIPFPVLGYKLARMFILANVVLAVVNLLPRKVAAMTGMQGTDGWHLLRAPFLNAGELQKQYIGYYAGEAMQAYSAKDLDAAKTWIENALTLDANSGVARNMLGVIQMARREYRESRETFLQILHLEDAREPGLHNLLLNNVAYLDALLRDRSLLLEADQFSAEALKHLPWLPAAIGTRGTVLVEMGKLEEGIVLLKRSMSMHADKQGKALNACHIAVGELGRGDLNAAHTYLATAKALDPQCFLLPDVEAQFTKPGSPFILPAEPQPV